MEQNKKITEPDNTAIRTALWRALHLQVDAKPYIIEDEVGLKLIVPEEGWQQRPDMHPEFTKRLRASIVARARFIEDLAVEECAKGISQYVILGAGLDTFAQRRTDIASRLQVFEIDQPGTQQWKRQRLNDLGFAIPEWLHFVAVDFETSSWWKELLKAGFNVNEPAFVACTGVSLYLTKKAIIATLRRLAKLAPGSELAMTFYLPIELMEKDDQPLQRIAMKGSCEAGTPMISFFTEKEILDLADNSGFAKAKTISTKHMEQLYFAGRTDNFLPASGEIFLVAST